MNGKSNALEFIRTIAVLRHCWWVPLLDAFLPSVFLIPTVNPLCGSPTNQPTHQRAFPLSFTHSLQLPVRLAIWDPSQIFPEYWHETTIFKTLEMYGLGNPFISNSIHISRSATLLSSRYNSFSFAHRIWVPGPLPIISAWLLEWLIRAVWGQDIKTRIARFAISAIHPQLFAFFDISLPPSLCLSLYLFLTTCLTSNNFVFLIFMPMFLSKTPPTLTTEQQQQSLALGLIPSIFSRTENVWILYRVSMSFCALMYTALLDMSSSEQHATLWVLAQADCWIVRWCSHYYFGHPTLGQCVVCCGRDQRRPEWQGCQPYLPQFRWSHEEPWVWWRFRRCQDYKRVSSFLIVSRYSLNGTNEMYSFRARFVQLAGPNNLHRFIKLCGEYTRCVTREAELREAGEVLSMQEYIPLRRNNSAVLLCLALNEYILGIDLPQDVYENPVFMKAYWAACDHVCWANVSFYTQKTNHDVNVYPPPSGCLFLQHGTVERPYWE